MQTNLSWEVLLDLDPRGPLRDRVRTALRRAIRDGRLPRGTALPPSRKLAAELHCSRWVVTEAYAQLVAEGYLEGRAGSATRVRWTSGDRAPSPAAPPAPRPPRFDLSTGLPDLRAFPRRRWAATLRSVVESVPYPELDYPAPGGHRNLRRVVGDYLERCRGVALDGASPVLCAGVTSGVVRICRRLRRAGVRAVAVEDPGWTWLWEAIESAGLRVVPVPVDEHGLRVEELDALPEVRAVLVTPANQFPTGSVLAPGRRAALLDWARRVDGVVLENDYDAEFRFDRPPVTSMQGMDPGRVCLFASVTRTLAPAVRIGWIVAPTRWVSEAEIGAEGEPPLFDQLAFAAFLQSGDYDRHLRASRLRYRTRRERVLEALARRLPDHAASTGTAGLQVLLPLGDVAGAAAVVAEAARREVRVKALGDFRPAASPPSPTLVLGYCNLPDASVGEAIDRLAASIRAVTVTD